MKSYTPMWKKKDHLEQLRYNKYTGVERLDNTSMATSEIVEDTASQA